MPFCSPDRRAVLVGLGSSCLLSACTTNSAQLTRSPLNWEKLSTAPYPGKQDDIAFGPNQLGWYGNGAGLIYRSENGGDSWTEVWKKPGTFVRALAFLDEKIGIMGNVGVGSFPQVTDPVALYRTIDGGFTWKPVDSIHGPAPSGICGMEVVSTMSIDRGHPREASIIHAAGRVGGPAHYLRSFDQGFSWQSFDLTELTAAIYDVKFIDKDIGFIAGSSDKDLSKAHGLILRTVDGGDTWRVLYRSRRPFEAVWKLHFPTEGTGYGSLQSYDPDPNSSHRFVVKTSDGGGSWSEVPLISNPKWRSFGIGFADNRVGWVGGNIGGLETRDGGASWRPVEMGQAVNKIRFVQWNGQRYVYAIGTDIHRLSLPPRTGLM